METEAKFLLPDREALERLARCSGAAGFSVEPGQALTVRDVYLDTPARALLAAGFACRRREQGGRILVTLKAAGSAPDAVHRRRELEVEIAADMPPARWPAGDARETTLRIIGEAPLVELLVLRQDRLVRRVMDGRRLVASMSLDEVTVEAGPSWRELEIELAPAGTERDLTALATWARVRFGLEPCLRSKFERALEGVAK